MSDAPDPVRIESLPPGPLTLAEARGLDGNDAFDEVAVAGSLVLHDLDLSLVVGLAVDVGGRIGAAVYQLEERGWYRIPTESDGFADLDEAVGVVEHVLTSGTGPDRTAEVDATTEARVSAVGADERDRLLEHYEERTDD
jgi:hypothetical protein